MSKKNKNGAASGKKNSLVILLLLLLVIGACGVAGYTFYEMNKMKNNKEAEGQENKQAVIAIPTYIPLDTFTVSLKPTERQPDRVLYIGLTLRVKDDASKALVEKFLPEIRSRLLMLFSQQTFDVLATDDGKQLLAVSIKTIVSQTLVDNHGAGVTDVLYNAFILR